MHNLYIAELQTACLPSTISPASTQRDPE